MSEQIAFDPEQDYPPEGAEVRDIAGNVVMFRAGMWRVTGGPHTGRVSYPFSEPGLAVARLYATSTA